jgi:hypothetical protein
MTQLGLRLSVPLTVDGRTFVILSVDQRFVAVPRGPTGVATADYTLTPAGWRDKLGRLRVANLAAHPLLGTSGLLTGKVTVNALVVDLTEAWLHLHRGNDAYKRYGLLTAGTGVTFAVLAHLGGNPFIWYAAVPDHVAAGGRVAPHVFFSPADHQEKQNNPNEQEYLLRNSAHFAQDGRLLFSYLTPPVDDVRVAGLTQQVPDVGRLRNVVGVRAAARTRTSPPGQFTTSHWTIGAGFQRAFTRSSGGNAPAQLLLMPQRVQGGSNGEAVTAQLKPITDAVVDLLQTNTSLLSGASDTIVTKDKLVLSAYSESGVDLWLASLANADRIKAIIGIEPQNLVKLTNDYRPKDEQGQPLESAGPPAKLGLDVIPLLLQRKVAVIIIGRHHLPQYHLPPLPGQQQVRLIPADPAKVFAYPPDPAANDFVKYRVHRFVDAASDPLMLPGETAILAELASRGIVGRSALSAIFAATINWDKTPVPPDGFDHWYSHQFALSGGDEMRLDPTAVYGRPVSYRTFYGVAVAAVG